MTKQLTLSNHAYERYAERIDGKKDRHQIQNYLSQLVSTTKDIMPGNDGSHVYYAKGLAIVVSADGSTITTVYRKARQTTNEIFSNIIGVVKNELIKEERYLKSRKRELLIAMHEAEIRKLKVFNPNTQRIIQKRIDEIVEELSDINVKILEADHVRVKFGIA